MPDIAGPGSAPTPGGLSREWPSPAGARPALTPGGSSRESVSPGGLPQGLVTAAAGGLRVLVLGGTSEGRALAAACADLPGVRTVSSLAGRTSAPLLPHGPVRVGGFGGVDGLASYLRSEGIGAVVDATHPFAATMTAATGTPLVVLRRPGWSERPGDDWHRVPSMAAAAAVVSKLGERVFLTTGRQTIGAFAGVDECWFLSRSVEPPAAPVPARLEVVLDRGPFTVEGERALLAEHRIDVMVTKDSGGVALKLAAARERGIPVLLIDRPPTPKGETVATVEAVVAWLVARLAETG